MGQKIREKQGRKGPRPIAFCVWHKAAFFMAGFVFVILGVVMELFTLFLLAVGLSMDAFAVTVTNVMCFRSSRGQIVLTALTFGLFQAVMPLGGYLTGQTFSVHIAYLDHWVALILLSFIGGKMVFEALKEMKTGDGCREKGVLTTGTLLLQGIATSIDAFAVGVSFAVLSVNIGAAASFIGGVTFVCCLFGGYLGKRFGKIIGRRAELLGGCILIAIGVKIFIEHAFFG
jgi:putative Mn2+ efflux pump MntP